MTNNQNSSDANAATMTNQAIPIPPSSPPPQLNNGDHHSESSCSSCLWTGVITCFGLSVYFAHIAFDDVNPIIASTVTTPSTTTPATNPKMIVHHPINSSNNTGTSNNVFRTWFQQQLHNYHHSPRTYTHNKPVFLCISAGWAVVGVYRWYLG